MDILHITATNSHISHYVTYMYLVTPPFLCTPHAFCLPSCLMVFTSYLYEYMYMYVTKNFLAVHPCMYIHTNYTHMYINTVKVQSHTIHVLITVQCTAAVHIHVAMTDHVQYVQWLHCLHIYSISYNVDCTFTPNLICNTAMYELGS